jgi:hypothetical protein
MQNIKTTPFSFSKITGLNLAFAMLLLHVKRQFVKPFTIEPFLNKIMNIRERIIKFVVLPVREKAKEPQYMK